MENKYVLSLLVENNSGVLRRVSGLFSRRNYNIESLSVGETEDESISRITIVTTGDEYIVEQIKSQVEKLVEVKKVEILDSASSIYRELLLVKVKTSPTNRAEILEISNIFRARTIDVSKTSLTLEITGDAKKLNGFLNLLYGYEILEIVRTGTVAIHRGDNRFADNIIVDENLNCL